MSLAPKTDVGLGLTATGASAAPAQVYGQYLTTHGIFILSYAEWIQILGAFYVAYLLLKVAKNGILTLRRNIKSKQ